MQHADDDVIVLCTPAHLNINKVSRQLRRTDLALHNCLLSVSDDAHFVARMAAQYPALPLVANLRCGLWYVASPDATAYFKSTDGHTGNWSFSTTRLNWHVAELAARMGGILLVDATRSSTKRFPDALAKTVPIWAAVLNHAVVQHRDRVAGAQSSAATAAWRAGVALPPWVNPSEAAAIDARVPEWAASLDAVGADVAGLSASLARPLRALWVSQSSPLWALPDVTTLPYTPLVCVSASVPLSGYGHRHASESATSGDAGTAGGDEVCESRTYAYVPGAGDDEEAWARGLTPQMFWQHRAELLAAGAGDVIALVDALVAAEQPAAVASAVTLPETQIKPHFDAAAPRLSSVATGLHDLPPMGTHVYAPIAGAASGVPLERGGVQWLGDCRLGCASFVALRDAQQLWSQADALLLCGDASSDDAASALAAAPGALLVVHVARFKDDRRSLKLALPHAAAFASAHLAAGRSVVVACADGLERAPAVLVALLAACFTEEPELSEAHGPPRLRFTGLAPPQPALTKVALRRVLALVSAHHPQARPTRGLLKQAFAFLRGGNHPAGGDAADEDEA